VLGCRYDTQGGIVHFGKEVVPVQAMKIYGAVEVQLHSFLILALGGGESLALRSASLSKFFLWPSVADFS
jgi:hypothetical protein